MMTSGYNGFGANPSDYVRAGSVISYQVPAIFHDWSDVIGFRDAALRTIQNAILSAGGVTDVAVDYSRLPFLGYGTLSVTVRATSDFARLADVVSIIQHGFYEYGDTLEWQPERATFGFVTFGTPAGASPTPTPQGTPQQGACQQGYRWVADRGCVKDYGLIGNLLADFGLEPTPSVITGAAVFAALVGVLLLRK